MPLAQSFHTATEEVAFMSEQVTKNDAELATWDDDHKDVYKDLMSYWDFLQNNQNMRTFAPRTKKANQKAFDSVKQTRMANWQANYRVA